MPATPWGPYDNPLLSGSFGVLQSEAASRASTQDVWRALRINAGTWQWQAQGGGELPPVGELERAGAQILHDQGVTIQHVNAYRQVAGQWRYAKESLQRLESDQQITAREIWQPPWATSTSSEVPSRYQVRLQWQMQSATGELGTVWGTYELENPLTTLNDVIDQAQSKAGRKPTSDLPLGSKITGVNDYEIAQI